jgi:hypothetical protein
METITIDNRSVSGYAAYNRKGVKFLLTPDVNNGLWQCYNLHNNFVHKVDVSYINDWIAESDIVRIEDGGSGMSRYCNSMMTLRS